MSSCKRTISYFSSLSSDPLFSTLLTFFALILLYFPRLLWRLVFSPVLLLTGLLLLSLLRLGATQRFVHQIKENNQTVPENESKERTGNDAVRPETLAAVPEEDHRRSVPQRETDDDAVSKPGDVSCACFEDTFVQWNVRAPLEVIYEEYEGEDDKDGSNESDPFTEMVPRRVGIERYPSLSLYYPETDSDNSSEDEFPTPGAWDSLDNKCFMWDDDEDRDELIEIALDKTNKKASEFQFEEENLIEIDISPTRNDEFPFPDVK